QRRRRLPAGGDRHRDHRRRDHGSLSSAPRGPGAGGRATMAGPHGPGAGMFPRDARIESYDPELAAAIAAETRRQEDHVELIASENYASPRVMEAQGSQLTNKYAEGYPGKRY